MGFCISNDHTDSRILCKSLRITKSERTRKMQEENIKKLTIQQVKKERKKKFIFEGVFFLVALLLASGTGLWICAFNNHAIKWLLGVLPLLIIGCRLVKKQKSFIISQIFCVIAVIFYFYLLHKLSNGNISELIEGFKQPWTWLFLISPLSVLILFSLNFIGKKLYLRYYELLEAQNNFILETFEKCDHELLLKLYKTNIKLYFSTGTIVALLAIMIAILTTDIEALNAIINITFLLFPAAVIVTIAYFIKRLILAQKIKSPFSIPFVILRQFITNKDVSQNSED